MPIGSSIHVTGTPGLFAQPNVTCGSLEALRTALKRVERATRALAGQRIGISVAWDAPSAGPLYPETRASLERAGLFLPPAGTIERTLTGLRVELGPGFPARALAALEQALQNGGRLVVHFEFGRCELQRGLMQAVRDAGRATRLSQRAERERARLRADTARQFAVLHSGSVGLPSRRDRAPARALASPLEHRPSVQAVAPNC